MDVEGVVGGDVVKMLEEALVEKVSGRVCSCLGVCTGLCSCVFLCGRLSLYIVCALLWGRVCFYIVVFLVVCGCVIFFIYL